MLSSIHISDDKDNLSNESEENNNIELQINLLNKKLLNYIYTDANLDYNYQMESKSLSDSKSDKTVDSSYFDTNEQINEVKINIFYTLSLDFRLNNDTSYNYYYFLSKKNELKTYRLVIQNFHLQNKQIIYQDKEYKFIPSVIKTQEFYFYYNEKNIKCYEDNKNNKQFKMILDNKPLLNITEFIQTFKNPEIQDLVKQSESTGKKDEDKSNKKSKEEKAKSISSKESNLSYMTKSDDSQKETKGERFYAINKENDYTRFFFKKYQKEIDGIYNMHKTINLNIKETITLEDGLKNLKDNYNDKNDLRCGIIYKNFDGNIIDAKEPIILEVKKGFRLIDLFNQIKQNSKVFHNLSSSEKLILPKYAIGIICTDYHDDYKDQITTLNDPYNPNNPKYTYLEHISAVFKRNEFNVIIGAFKTPKILEYPLDIVDWEIEGKNLTKRVDLEYMNKATGINKTKEDLANIEERLKKKYKSVTHTGTVSIGEYKQKLVSIGEYKHKLEEKNQLIKSQKDLITNIQDEILKFDNMKASGSEKNVLEIIKKKLDEFKKKTE